MILNPTTTPVSGTTELQGEERLMLHRLLDEPINATEDELKDRAQQFAMLADFNGLGTDEDPFFQQCLVDSHTSLSTYTNEALRGIYKVPMQLIDGAIMPASKI